MIACKIDNDLAARDFIRFSKPTIPASVTAVTTKNDDGNSVFSVVPDATFNKELNDASATMWSTPSCYSVQLNAIEAILFGDGCIGPLVLVDCTGRRKSIFYK